MDHAHLTHAARIRRTATFALSCTLLLIVGGVFAKGTINQAPNAVATPAQAISSAGPLDNIWLGDDGAAQISYAGDSSYEVFPPSNIPGDYGTFIVVNDALYAPDLANHGNTATSSIGSYTPFTPQSQSGVTGSGTAGNPYSVTTVLGVGATGLTLTHVDSYVVGQESYRTDVTITNASGSPVDAILYRAMDCYLGSTDTGYGFVAGTSVGCSLNANNTPPGRIEQLVPLNAGSSYLEAGYSQVWAAIGTHLPFDNTCRCAENIDNGAGISWTITIPANGSITRSHLTTFSPLGAAALYVTKTADQANVSPAGTNGYTITVSNPNATVNTLDSIVDTLPAGFSYQSGSSSGATTTDPVIAGQALTWTGSFPVPANGTLSLHFNVTAASSAGTFYNEATATGAGLTIAGSGPTAPVTIGGVPPQQNPVAALPMLSNGLLALLALLVMGIGLYFTRRRITH